MNVKSLFIWSLKASYYFLILSLKKKNTSLSNIFAFN